MSLEDRKNAIDNICRTLAITKYDIEYHQSVSDLSLNIHGENFFRDVFNFIYKTNYVNCNFNSTNAACIDLIDVSAKKAIQITSTRTKFKIEKTLKALKIPKYKNYEIKIFFIIDKPAPQQATINQIKTTYGIDLKTVIFDLTNIVKEINNLTTDEIIELNHRYFATLKNKYTDKIAVDLIIKHLLKNKKTVIRNYNDDFGNLETDKKLALNNINDRISAKINDGLDYRSILEKIDTDNTILESLRELIIDEFYKEVLIEVLGKTHSIIELKKMKTIDIHEIACSIPVDFNKVIYNLHFKIEDIIEIKDFNTMNIGWIIISFFFEICDIGRHEI